MTSMILRISTVVDTNSNACVGWTLLPLPLPTHLSHALYDVGGQVQVQVHCEHDAVVVFNGEDTRVVCQGLVKNRVL